MRAKVTARVPWKERAKERNQARLESSTVAWNKLLQAYDWIRRTNGEPTEEKIYVIGQMPHEGREAMLRRVAKEGAQACLITLPVASLPIAPGEWLAVRFERVKGEPPAELESPSQLR